MTAWPHWIKNTSKSTLNFQMATTAHSFRFIWLLPPILHCSPLYFQSSSRLTYCCKLAMDIPSSKRAKSGAGMVSFTQDLTNCTDFPNPCSPTNKDMAFAVYSSVVFLKEVVENLHVSISNRQFPCSTSKKEKLQTLYDKLNLMDSSLRETFGESYLENGINNLVISLQRDLEKLLHEEKLCDRVKLMDSFLIDSLSESHSARRIRDVLVSMRNHVSTLFRKEVQTLHNKFTLMDSLLASSFGESYLQSNIKEVLLSMKENLETEMGLLLSNECLELYNSISSLCWLLADFSGENYNNEMMTEFKNRINVMGDEVLNQVQKYQPEVLADLTKHFDSSILPIVEEGGGNVNWSLDLTMLSVFNGEICYIYNELMMIPKHNGMIGNTVVQYLDNHLTSATGPSQRYPNKYGNVVGRQNDLAKMLCCLTGNSTNFEVFPIIGAVGIGKTTFAKELYNDPRVINQFDVRAWATMSQECRPRALLLNLLRRFNLYEIHEWDDKQLCEKLYRCLKHKRYLIILDDVWNKEVWDDLSEGFPNDKNGSKVVLICQLESVALHASPNIRPHYLGCLNSEESWELLCSKIFPNGMCPSELVPIGKQIAYNCHGLALAIVLIGGLLSKMNRTLIAWEEIAQNVGSLCIGHPQYFQSILNLCYNHLPNALKACFLYMGLFPKDYEIPSNKLIYLWIAEGFIHPNVSKTMEEIAKDYLQDLVTRNLVMITRKRFNGGFKMCQIHHLVREFCLRESRKENYFHVICDHGEMSTGSACEVKRYYKKFLKTDLHHLQRLILGSDIYEYMKFKASFPFTYSFFCFEPLKFSLRNLRDRSGLIFKFLKILDIMHVCIFPMPSEIFRIKKLKYLALSVEKSFPVSELRKFHCLQTCLIDGVFNGHLPREFWDMTQLRHFHLKRDSKSSDNTNIEVPITILQNLQSLSTISPSSCSKEIFLSMPNLKKLGVLETSKDYEYGGWFDNLRCLKQLEVLNITFSGHKWIPEWHVFPQNLVKLTLNGTKFLWEEMHQLCKLPKLEVLKLKNYAFSGSTWMVESRFYCLKFLMIDRSNLELWSIDGNSHFPRLEHLVLKHCWSLNGIPSGVCGTLLEKMELHCCSHSAANSATRLQDEQQQLGNDKLKVHITKRQFQQQQQDEGNDRLTIDITGDDSDDDYEEDEDEEDEDEEDDDYKEDEDEEDEGQEEETRIL